MSVSSGEKVVSDVPLTMPATYSPMTAGSKVSSNGARMGFPVVMPSEANSLSVSTQNSRRVMGFSGESIEKFSSKPSSSARVKYAFPTGGASSAKDESERRRHKRSVQRSA